MKLSEILAISGQPGLFKFIAQTKAGIIVESLIDNKRIPVGANAKVSSISDIAIFTSSDDMPLSDVFQAIYDKSEAKEVASPKGLSNDQIKAMMQEYLPEYDKDRVYVSDMKKLFTWYNILVNAGFTTFVESEPEGEEGAAPAAKVSKPATEKPKTAAVKNSGQASSKSKSASKVRTIKAS
ncbi:MAG: DUF5606 domain-containing protein [Rikenellaceae bacterium]